MKPASSGRQIRFRDRRDAGRQLAARLSALVGNPDVRVLGLARGGVPVAAEVALALRVPLDVFIIRKLGMPGQRELAMGAIASGGVRVLNREVVARLVEAERIVEEVAAAERQELERREAEYRGSRPAPDLRGKVVVLVDDGLATGATMRAAVQALRQKEAARIIVAVPVGSPSACAKVAAEADAVLCLTSPEDFEAVGQFYDNFAQSTDEEVRELLR